MDQVSYTASAPWPIAADGLGPSLHRRVDGAYADDPANWIPAVPTPDIVFTNGTPPVITRQPESQTVLETSTVRFDVGVSGSEPFLYQWRFNGTGLAGATNSALVLTNVMPSQAGAYLCVVFGPTGVAVSSNATLTVLIPPSITQQPTNSFVFVYPDPRVLPTNNSTIFRVLATTANGPLRYQWRFNGSNLTDSATIQGSTTANLTLTNIVFQQAGNYECTISDGNGTVLSSSVVLGVVPYLVVPPQPQTIAAGADVNASAVIQAYPPPFMFRWQRGNTTSRVDILDSSLTTFVSFNSTALGYNLGNYNMRLYFTNLFTGTNLIILTNRPAYAGNNLNVTVLLDTDYDGIPDAVESLLGLDTNNTADALGDLDGDRMTNLAEYRAGTDPSSSNSYLRIEQSITPGMASLNFAAASNRTYTIQFSDSLPAASWFKLADFVALRTNRVEVVIDPAWNTNRFYRVATPRTP